MNRLSAKERKLISDFIINTFGINDFRAFMLDQSDLDIEKLIPYGANWQTAVTSIIFDLDRKYEIAPILLALEARFPEQDAFKKILHNHQLAYQTVDETGNPYQNSALESMLNDEPMFDAAAFFNQFGKAKRCVCKIEVPQTDGGLSVGTGFLVGPHSVLTNYHVVQTAIENSALIANIRVIFDFHKLENQMIDPGVAYSLDTENPIPVYSEYCIHDASGNPDIQLECDEPKHDYAILNLTEQVGNMPYGKKQASVVAKRGWVDLKEPTSNSSYENGNSLVILQHPEGMSMKLSIGLNKIIDTSPNQIRLRYGVNTLAGSSGSPVFNTNFELIALHNVGDPRFNPTFNQGVVIGRIIEDLNNRDFNIELCQTN